MIIDMRCRLTTREAGAYFYDRMSKSGRLSEVPALAEGTIEAFFKEIGDAGVTTAVSVSGNNPGIKIGRDWDLPDRTTPNDILADVQKKYPGKFIGVAGIDAGNVFHKALDEMERCVKVLGLKAVYIEPGRSPGCLLNDRRLYPIYQKCVDLDVPIILQTSGSLGSKNIDYANPKYVEEIAEDFPDLNFICAHGCYPFVREMILASVKHHNIWTSPDNTLLRIGTEDWVKAININDNGFSNKLIFGTAYPLRPIKDYVDKFFALPWKEEYLDKILYKNALKALKLENDPVFREMYKL